MSFVAFSPQNDVALTAASQEGIKLWDIQSGKLRWQKNKRNMTLSAARFSSSGHQLALALIPQQIQLWDLQTKTLRQHWYLPRPQQWKPTAIIIYAIGFSRNERYLYTEDSRGYGLRWRIGK